MSLYNPYALPVDPLLGGSLSTGPTGLAGMPRLPGLGTLPYGGINGLAGQVPVGAGQQALTAANALRPFEAAATESAAGRGLMGSITSRLPSALGNVALKSPTLKGSIGYGALGTIGAMGVDRLNVGGANSLADQFLTGAAFGGGQGLAAGPWGAAIGAPVGGLANVAYNALGTPFSGEKEEAAKPEEVLANAIDTASIPPEYESVIIDTYDTAMDLAKGLEGDERKAAETMAFQTAGAQIQAVMDQRRQQALMDQQGMGGGSGPSMLALQQQAQSVFEPLAQDIETNGQLYAQAMQGIRGSLPAEYASIADAQVARELSSSDKLADAYRAQAALTPVVQRLTQYQQDQNAFASQMFQQAQAQMAAAMSSGQGFGQPAGATDINALLAAQ